MYLRTSMYFVYLLVLSIVVWDIFAFLVSTVAVCSNVFRPKFHEVC